MTGKEYNDLVRNGMLPTRKHEDFEIRNNVLVRYRGNSQKIIIPKNVVLIAPRVFMGFTKITSLYIYDNVILDICTNAFKGCTSLYDIHIPKKYCNEEKLKQIGFNDKQITLILK